MIKNNITKIVGATLASVLGMSSAYADSLGVTINATSFSAETHPATTSIIRKVLTKNKVANLKSDPERATYMTFEPLGVTGATHLTVIASSGALKGGALNFYFANHYNSEMLAASVQIPYTGGWDTFQEITVPLNAEVMTQFGHASLFLVVENQPTYGYDLQSFKFIRSDVGATIEAESYDRERFGPDYPNDIVNMGTKVGYLREGGNWMDYDQINFTGGAHSVTVRASSGNRKGGVLVIYNGPPGAGRELGRVQINYTGGWDKFEDFSANIPAISGGIMDLSFAFESTVWDAKLPYLFDLDHFRFNMNPSNNVGYWINAATFDGESQPDDQNTIRDMGTKVGFLRNINPSEYFVFDNMDVAGANSVTIRYSSAGTGGLLFVRSATHYTNDVAVLDLQNTGGWDKIQEVTVPLDLENLYNGRSLFFTIEDFSKPEGVAGPYKFDIHAFKFNP